MISSNAGFAPTRLSTDSLPERDRLEFWREAIARGVAKLEVDPVPDHLPSARMTLVALPGVDIACLSDSGMCYRRTPDLIDSDDLLLVVALAGARTMKQLGRKVTTCAGEATLLSCAETGHAIPRELQRRRLDIRIPYNVLSPMVGDVEDAICRPIPSTVDALRLLVGYAAALDDLDIGLTPSLALSAATHIQDLVALSIGATRDAAAIARGRGLRAARLKAIKADILGNLGQHDLTVSNVALRHRITPRYVQMLFETEGRTFSSFVLDQRLSRAHQLLTDPDHAGWTVSAIAFEVGFGDLSYFHRTFRRLYGATPADIRRGPRQDSGNGIEVRTPIPRDVTQ
ncbi:helix-turn-helix transcriptional regulator [Aquamicrobium terrae]|uniref:AraC-like DNA-binding protein n=1 Tax=Aquamicrobium terrae TaxID=1324945 RepID=A0ABV2N5H0_9HYPH